MTKLKKEKKLRIGNETCNACFRAAIPNLDAPAESVVENCTATYANRLEFKQNLSLSPFFDAVKHDVYPEYRIVEKVYNVVTHSCRTLISEFNHVIAAIGCSVSSRLTVVDSPLQFGEYQLAAVGSNRCLTPREHHSGFLFFPCISSSSSSSSREKLKLNLYLSNEFMQTGLSRRIGRLL